MAKKKYRATNSIQGLQKDAIETGAIVELEEKVAAPFVLGGSLVQLGKKQDESEPPTADTPAGDSDANAE